MDANDEQARQEVFGLRTTGLVRRSIKQGEKR